MDKEKIARCLILQYLSSCCDEDSEHHDELEVSIECLKTIWEIDDFSVNLPNVRSIVDLIPEPKYDTEKAMQLKQDGNNLLKDGNLDGALQKYNEAIKTDPTQSTFYCNRAAVYSKQEKHELAIEDCEQAISLDPEYATAYSRLGFAYYKLGKIDKAREAYKRGLTACPNNQSLKENLESLGPDPSPQQQQQMPNPDAMMGLLSNFMQDPQGMMNKVTENLYNSPETREMMNDPEMQTILQQIQTNPLSILSMANDPRVQRLFKAIIDSWSK